MKNDQACNELYEVTLLNRHRLEVSHHYLPSGSVSVPRSSAFVFTLIRLYSYCLFPGLLNQIFSN